MQRCRECKSLGRQVKYVCGDTILSHSGVNKRNTWACYKPCESPLLVDALVSELCKALEVIDAYAPNDPVRDSGNQVLERYQKEEGEADDPADALRSIQKNKKKTE